MHFILKHKKSSKIRTFTFRIKEKILSFILFSFLRELSSRSDCLLACVTALHQLIGMDKIRRQNRIAFGSSLTVIRGQKFESEVRFSRHPIGRPASQWKSSFLKSGPRKVIRYGKVESDHHSSRNSINGPENQWKVVSSEVLFRRYDDAGKTNIGWTSREPMHRPWTNAVRVPEGMPLVSFLINPGETMQGSARILIQQNPRRIRSRSCWKSS